ncbi:hypothetical protein DU508_18520 [Pedobacter chinensis]|uniref:Uncharacterized protein n=2 Tax=Pedobacter chinensis TaxID=2282421 RepID=A0A369PWQ3_9SPHI|nr:hypothetical protein DU508_18520 [Pedobacter chinensis]
MRNIYYSIVIILITLTTCITYNALAQGSIDNFNHQEFAINEKIDGNQIIEVLFKERYLFNKNLIRHSNRIAQLPQTRFILKGNQSVITFDGHDYLFNNGQIVEIKGVQLSKAALTAITERITLLDRIQKDCSESVNAEYNRENRDLQYIKAIDRQYFSALKQLSSITANIAAKARKPNASITIEMAMAQINIPDVSVNHNKENELDLTINDIK